jgi:hypothetical protein
MSGYSSTLHEGDQDELRVRRGKSASHILLHHGIHKGIVVSGLQQWVKFRCDRLKCNLQDSAESWWEQITNGIDKHSVSGYSAQSSSRGECQHMASSPRYTPPHFHSVTAVTFSPDVQVFHTNQGNALLPLNLVVMSLLSLHTPRASTKLFQ